MRALALILWIFAVIIIISAAQSESDPREVVQASEILEMIERGEPVNYSNVIIEGDLNLSDLDLPEYPVVRNSVGYISYLNGVEVERFGLLPGKRKIVKSAIGITDSLINGSMNFNSISFFDDISLQSTICTEDVSFQDSQFNKSADFLWIKFYKNADFSWSRFNQTANFGEALFNKDADFRESQFDQTAFFHSAQFNQEAKFHNSQFNETANFVCSLFNLTANFNMAQFNGSAKFNEARFAKETYFRGSRFKGTVDFINAHFDRDLDFCEVSFNQSTNFRWAQFNYNANFYKARFDKSTDFNFAQFNQTAVFIEAQFIKSAYFGNSLFNQTAYFRDCQFADAIFICSYLKSADFGRATFSGDLSFEGSQIDRLNLKDAEFCKIFLRWKSIGHLEYDETAYLLLMGNFKNLNFLEDANDCYYDYRNDRRATLPWYYQPVDYALMLFYGYGVKPDRPVLWSIIFVAFFAGLFWWRQGILPVREGEPEEEANRFSLLEAVAFSAMTFLSGGKLVFDPPEYRIASGRPWRDVQISKALFILERLLGMVLIIMFAIAVGKTIILGGG